MRWLFLLLLVIPPGLLAFAWAWHRLEHPLKDSIPEGWEPVLLLPALLLSAAVALWLADPVQVVLFAGDFRQWLTNEAGISYDQRNALVVRQEPLVGHQVRRGSVLGGRVLVQAEPGGQ